MNVQGCNYYGSYSRGCYKHLGVGVTPFLACKRSVSLVCVLPQKTWSCG